MFETILRKKKEQYIFCQKAFFWLSLNGFFLSKPKQNIFFCDVSDHFLGSKSYLDQHWKNVICLEQIPYQYRDNVGKINMRLII